MLGDIKELVNTLFQAYRLNPHEQKKILQEMLAKLEEESRKAESRNDSTKIIEVRMEDVTNYADELLGYKVRRYSFTGEVRRQEYTGAFKAYKWF